MKRSLRRMVFAMLRLGAALGDRDQLAKGLRVTHCQVGEHLAIDVDACHLEPVHELVVRHALASRGSVDPGDPEPAHVTLARPTVAIGVLERVEHGLVCWPEQGPMRHPEAFGQVEDLLVALPSRDASLYAWHLSPCPSGRALPGATAERPSPSAPAACCTDACAEGSCAPAGDSFARAGARSFRSWSPGTAWPTRDVYAIWASIAPLTLGRLGPHGRLSRRRCGWCGRGRRGRRSRRAGRGQDHDHVPALEQRHALHRADGL